MPYLIMHKTRSSWLLIQQSLASCFKLFSSHPIRFFSKDLLHSLAGSTPRSSAVVVDSLEGFFPALTLSASSALKAQRLGMNAGSPQLFPLSRR